jgi:type I restriction enzyme, S subunit
MKNLNSYQLSELLIPKQLMFSINPFDTYKQIKLRIKHQGVELRCLKKGSEIVSKQYLAKKGQFIISKIDARNGAMGIIPESLDNAIVTGDFLLYDFNKSLIIPEYFSYISQTPSFDNSCKICSEGSTNRVRLKLDRFLAFSIELPPIKTQESIVSKIERVKSRLE